MWTFGFALILVLLGYAVWQMFFENRVTVDPGNRERVVIRDLGGNMKVLGPGEHYLLPWWIEFQRVNINRNAVETVGQVKTSNGVELVIGYRYDIIAGRPFDPENGQLTVRRIDDASEVRDDDVIKAVTRIEYSQHEEQIAQRVRSEVEAVLAAYSDSNLLTPASASAQVPQPGLPEKYRWIYRAVDRETRQGLFPHLETPINTVSDLYERLGKVIELRVNYLLRLLGINIVSFHINNLTHKDELAQSALEMKARRARLHEATRDDDMSEAERFALGTDQLGQAAIGAGLSRLGKEIGDGIRKGIKEAGGNQPRDPE